MDRSNKGELPLLAAIRQYSDPGAWAGFERLIGLDKNKDARADWDDRDWARYDFQMKRLLSAAKKRQASLTVPSGDALTILHRWVRLRVGFRARLRSGELVATGFVPPIGLNDERSEIPANKWVILEPDFENSRATGEGLEIVEILVRQPPGRLTIRAETACHDWLVTEAENIEREVIPFNKKGVFKYARDVFGDSLSWRSFDRAWAASAPAEWRRSGRKRKVKSVQRIDSPE